jgi:hypothetical protein
MLIVMRNCENQIEPYLAGALAQTDLEELVVVDVRSSDGSRKKVTDFLGLWCVDKGSKVEKVVWSRDEIRLHEGGAIDFVRVHPLTNLDKDLATPFRKLTLRRWHWWRRFRWPKGPRQYAKSLITATGVINVAWLDGEKESLGGKK